MLPIKLTLKGIGPYVAETISFLDAPGGVVAIVGENGAGKTMLVDSVFAALYRYFPSRDSIYKYCQGKAYISFDFEVNSFKYRTVINIDTKKREMEPWLFQGNSDTELIPLTDGKSGTFDAAIAKLVGPAEVVLASVFSAQNKAGSFAQLPKARRKELFIDMLGLGRLQVISDEAAARDKKSKEEYDRVLGRVSLLKSVQEAHKTDLEDLRRQLDGARTEVATAESDIKAKTFEVSRLKAHSQAAKEIEARQFPVRKRKQAALKELTETERALQDSLAQAERVDYYKSLAGKFDELGKQLELRRLDVTGVSGRIQDYHRQMATYTQAVRDLEAQANAQRVVVISTNKDLKRAKIDSAIIDKVPCHAEGECASCEFLVNAVKMREIIGELEERLDNATASGLVLDQQIKSLPRPEAEQLVQLETLLSHANSLIKILEPQYEEANNARNKLVAAQAAAVLIEDLRARKERLSFESAQADREMADLETELAKSKEAEIAFRKAEKALEVDQEALDGARLHLNTLLASVGRAELEAEQALQAGRELEELLPVLGQLDQDRKSWNLLSRAFSKTGIQSLEIDAAGPTVSEIVNDLLFSCFGPRFSVRLVTQVLKDDKSGYKDDFDIYVTDSTTEREGSIDDLSGGEKVIVCEAVSLAIALFNRQRADVGWASIFRDEASSAVDDRRAPLYIKMLRRAREQGHFERLFFIAHQQRVTEGADSRVLVADGKISFE